MKRRICAWIIMTLLVIQTMGITSYGETQEKRGVEDPLGLYSQSAVLLDAATGRVLYGKNEMKQRPMASTTKIMTCILALEKGDMNSIVTASAHAAAQPKVHLGVRKGEQYYLKDLLYSLMLESHNDAAVMIAEHIGGSVEGFAKLMNKKAKELGCEDTYFVTPNGLDAVKADEQGIERIHATTAVDLGKIMNYCVLKSLKNKEFLKITSTQNYSFSSVKGTRSFSCSNHNAFLNMMSGVLSGKTGFTGGAGYSYVAALQDEGRTFSIVLLGCGWPPHKTYKWSDARKLMNYGKDQYHYKEVFEPKDFFPIPVKEGIPHSKNLKEEATTSVSMELGEEDQSLTLLMRQDEKIRIAYYLPKTLTAPVKAGTLIGKAVYYLEDSPVKSYPVYTCETVERLDYSWCLKQCITSFVFSTKREDTLGKKN